MVRATIAFLVGILYLLVLLVIVVQRSKRFKSAYYNYLLSLGIGDTFSNIYMFLHGYNYCNDAGTATYRCYLNLLPETSDAVALFSMACIATTRYVAVAKPTKIDVIISSKRQVISIVATWICGISVGIYYITLNCALQLDSAFKVIAFDHVLAGVALVVSLIILGVCAATGKLLWEMAKTHIGDGKMRKRSLYLFMTVLIMLFLYVFIRITTAVRVAITDPADTGTLVFVVFAVYGSRASRVIFTTVNPIMYLVFDKEVRKAVIEVLYRIRRRNKVLPTATVAVGTIVKC